MCTRHSGDLVGNLKKPIFSATSKGLFVQWNNDHHRWFENGNRLVEQRPFSAHGSSPAPVVTVINRNNPGPVIKPGLEVYMNVPKTREFCAKNGIPFHAGVTNPIQRQPIPGAYYPGIDMPPPYPGQQASYYGGYQNPEHQYW